VERAREEEKRERQAGAEQRRGADRDQRRQARDAQKRLEQAERRANQLEERVGALQAQLDDAALYATPDGVARAKQLSHELDAARAELEAALESWGAAGEALELLGGAPA
jgi:DNA repair exonuclease SbcCD ATPase subunit